ncbi:efflux RND transporter periplasmic adaptor subunit [Flavobacterium agricola]|uniref:Efflux RND transporter periplasmic adaptor subunit n=1 Tax=Flavobacterium agricola TaxID=2870839 RepID=A0ABY6LVH2_9FLAO|nr:efflux RND transporter periplasmic adaptor subunit [Flavobacterium agricola]UYW00320.1 efflux RND transporter periplasmic adaptor subunit [Flavobacterium agricola]
MKKTTYLLASALLFLASCKTENHEEQTDQAPQPEYCLSEQMKKTTTFTAVAMRPIQEQLVLTGRIEYNQNDLVAFKSLLTGVVDEVKFELGDAVKKGQVLAVVKSTEIQDLTQERRALEGQVVLLKKQLTSKKELLDDGLIAKSEVLETEYELQNASFELEKIKANLNLYRAAGDGMFQILAPKNGYIVQKNIAVGQTITGEDENPLFSISNLKEVWVMVNIYPNELKYVKTGNPVKVKTLTDPDKFYSGKIDKIYNVLDDEEHVLKARIVLENTDLNLLPGLRTDIIVDKDNALGEATAIPNQAIIFENNKSFVVLYIDDCNLKTLRVNPIGKNQEYTYIKENLEPNEKVVTQNALILYEELNK